MALASYTLAMKTMTIRLPEQLVAEIEHESRLRKMSKSEVVRERLRQPVASMRKQPDMMELIGDLIGSVDGLPSDLSANKKGYLRACGYGKNGARR